MKKFFALAWLALPCHAVSVYYLATGQTGAQTQIDVNHTSSWLLTTNVNFDLGGGLFTMKDGSSTSDTISLKVYLGSDATGTLLTTLTLTHTTFCSQTGNCGQFAMHQFLFPTAVSLTSGTTYFATLTSSAPDVQSQAYFIKNDTYFISDINGTPISIQPVVFDAAPQVGASATPEPGTAWLLAGALALWRWRRHS